MSKSVEQRIDIVEAEVKLIRRAVTARPNLAIDEKNWETVKSDAKKVRAKLYKARYG